MCNHSAAVGQDGALFVWGSGGRGQLGTGDDADRLAPTLVTGLPTPVRQVAAGDFHTGIVTQAGDLLLCGYGQHGRLGLGDEDERTLPTLLRRDGCGYGQHGRLGLGDEDERTMSTLLRRDGCRRRGSAASGL